MRQCLRSVRSLSRDFRFTLPALLVLALTFAFSTLAFWLYGALYLSDPNLDRPEELVAVYRFDRQSQQFGSVSFPDIRKLATFDGILAGVAGFVRVPVHFAHGQTTLRLQAEAVTENYFDVLGIRAVKGEVIKPASSTASTPYVVISHSLWRSVFGAREDIREETLLLSGFPFRILGVAPPGFAGTSIDWGGKPDIWIPIGMLEHANPVFKGVPFRDAAEMTWMLCVARLHPQATFQQAEAALSTAQLQDFPGVDSDQSVGYRILPINEARFWPGHQSEVKQLVAMFGLVALALLITGCLNATNLQLTRQSAKKRDAAICAALGASRWQLFSHRFYETLILYLSAGCLGFGLAYLLKGMLAALGPNFVVPLSLSFDVNIYIPLFALLLSILSAVLFGAVPLYRTHGFKLSSDLRNVGVSIQKPSDTRLGTLIAGGQVAMSLIMVSLTILLTVSVFSYRNTSVPFQVDNIQIVSLDLATHGYDSDTRRRHLSEIMTRLNSIQRVEAVALSDRTPITRIRPTQRVKSFDQLDDAEGILAEYATVSEGYFDALGIPLLQGRAFSRVDASSASDRSVIINEVLAKQLWPEGDLIGRLILIGRDVEPSRVIGVVPGASYHTIKNVALPHFYIPFPRSVPREVNLFFNTKEPQHIIVQQVREIVTQQAGDVPVHNVRTLRSELMTSLRQEITLAKASGAVAILITIFTAVGLYGIISFSISTRRQEFAIRAALGATNRQIAAIIFRWGYTALVVGLVLGVPGSVLLSIIVSPYTISIDHFGLTFVIVLSSLLVAILVFLGLSLPAQRAIRDDPWNVLRGI